VTTSHVAVQGKFEHAYIDWLFFKSHPDRLWQRPRLNINSQLGATTIPDIQVKITCHMNVMQNRGKSMQNNTWNQTKWQ
jgi:hypothetical protein